MRNMLPQIGWLAAGKRGGTTQGGKENARGIHTSRHNAVAWPHATSGYTPCRSSTHLAKCAAFD